MSTFYEKLKERAARLRLVAALTEPARSEFSIDSLPPFHNAVAAVKTRLRAMNILYVGTTAVLLAVIVFQQRVIFHRLFQKINETVVIVPGAPEFIRVRPGQIPDESVFIFAEQVAANLGNFSWRNVRYHYGKVAAYMHPSLRGRFEQELESRVKDWTERKVDQSFAYERAKKFDLVSDSVGQKYRVAVPGLRTTYIEGHVFAETRELLSLEFRPRGDLTAERSFLFDLEKVEWLTPTQHEALEQARALEVRTQEKK